MSIDELFKNGYTIIPSLIDKQTCDNLKDYLDKEFNEDLDFNYFKGHYQQNLPIDYNNIPKDILLNNKIHDLLHTIFNNNYYMSSYTCNSNLSNCNQPFHMDCSHYHPINSIKNFGSPGPPFQIIINTYLQDTDSNNGSLEIVPGSHLFTNFEIDEDGIIDDKYVKNYISCDLPKGSVIIRDKRTWHRGTKNKSNNVRYMTGTTYTINWYKLNKLKFKKECIPIFDNTVFSNWNLEFF